MDINQTLAEEFKLSPEIVDNIIVLIDEGNTIPFIARYRKEKTGALDDQVLRNFNDRLVYLRSLEEQRQKVFDAITEQGAMTDEIALALSEARTVTEIDDIYRPFRPKKKTRASVAKAKGLQPLADAIYEQKPDSEEPIKMAEEYINPELGVETAEDALKGAMDIIAELISDDPNVRKRVRYVCMMNGKLKAEGKQEDMGVYDTYKAFSCPLTKLQGYQILAVNRGEKEDFLRVSVDFDDSRAYAIISSEHIKDGSPCTPVVMEAGVDAWSRLIFPSIERDIRNELTDNADDTAIKVFSTNLRQLLMQPPVKNRIALGLDPGYRMGCKCAVVDPTGKVLETGVINPVPEFKRVEQSKAIVRGWIRKHGVQIVAIGNGTASHETEVFTAEVLKDFPGVAYMVVSEAGASVYSASPLAAKEFPEYDVNLRSAISIARRLQDPLAELVKIDPKAIGVGQYQHDLPQNRLSEALDGVVEDCVNAVGVDLNTASPSLLTRVSGVSSAIAGNIVAYREQNGAFRSRAELLKVPKLGPKAYEQCAGFLRVPESRNFLDHTAVHPESYEAAKGLLEVCGIPDSAMRAGKIEGLDEKIDEIGMKVISEKLGVGIPTLTDIAAELQKPGRDPRDELPPPMLRTDVLGIESLTVGMELRGTVRNVVDFGAFVDIGVHEDGLVHKSRMADRRIDHPSEIVKVGDIVTVWVESVDLQRKRIGLTMRKPKN
ncbi:MAG: RNA-binding transcriptional accessory protein [Clostridia bacterium]|nr:RNA-binding transcriptional accessory protein [Clostridia bacterium]